VFLFQVSTTLVFPVVHDLFGALIVVAIMLGLKGLPVSLAWRFIERGHRL
jgi:hypothetical protein